MSNTDLWDRLGRTDPKHTKTFKRSGGFEGTAIKPMFSYRRMTEEFGPCGVGWGIGEPTFQVVPAAEEILVYCTVSVWHEKPEQRVFGVGGDKVAGKNKYGVSTDDEAFKKAFTDAVTNALKLIGVGADVHMGMFDDNKYVNTMREEFATTHEVDPQAHKEPSKNDAARTLYSNLQKQMRGLKTSKDLAEWWEDQDCRNLRANLPADWRKALTEECGKQGRELKALEANPQPRGTDKDVATIQEAFPGARVNNETITNSSGRELNNMEAAE